MVKDPELLKIIRDLSADQTKKFLRGLDVLSSGGSLDDFSDDEITLLTRLRIMEPWFRKIAPTIIDKVEMESKKKDFQKRNVPPGRWGL